MRFLNERAHCLIGTSLAHLLCPLEPTVTFTICCPFPLLFYSYLLFTCTCSSYARIVCIINVPLFGLPKSAAKSFLYKKDNNLVSLTNEMLTLWALKDQSKMKMFGFVYGNFWNWFWSILFNVLSSTGDNSGVDCVKSVSKFCTSRLQFWWW